MFGELWHLAPTYIEIEFGQIGTKFLATVMLQLIPSSFGKISGNFWKTLSSVQLIIFENFLVCCDYCVISHNPASCSLINCQLHLVLIADYDRNNLIGMLDCLGFRYQHVDGFYTLFKNKLSGNVLVNNEKNI